MTSAEEVKSKLNIVDIIQEYLPLKKRGASFFALCPFHQEKTSSFHVSAERQFYKCFGCGESGDIFSFTQKMEGMEFPEALRRLAEKAGVKIEQFDARIQSRKNRILDLLDLAAKFYHETLLRSSQAEEAREYLSGRGLAPTTIELFQLGFAVNSWDALFNFLVSKKYGPDEIFLSGLAVRRERGDGFYDRFRGRIMFPIRDLHGAVAGFTARILPSEEKNPQAGGKYVNTPQTEFYNKSRILFGLDLAKREIKNQDTAVIVEGNMDAISSFQAGVKNVVASSGTALTEEQVALLRRFTENICLSFDMDKAGENAAEKGIDLLLRAGVNVKIITLPKDAGKDPDEAIRKNPDIWKEAISSARPVMEYLFSVAEERFGLSDGEARKRFGKMIISHIAKINDKIEQNFWLGRLSAVLGVSEGILREYLVLPKEAKGAPGAAPNEKSQSVNRHVLLSRRLMALLLFFTQSAEFVIDRISPKMLGDEKISRLYEEAIVHYNSTGALKYQDFRQKLGADELIDALDRIVLEGETEFDLLEAENFQKEVLACARDLKECYLAEERKRLTRELALAESRGDQPLVAEISYKINELFKLQKHF
ncbi:DNA primase [Candidatus Uhrbacteria bacterium]|nr:DNA primase [Candidatus Uhrbacteria bacterium]